MKQRGVKELSGAVLSIALPLTLQNVLAWLVNLADTVMVGKLGTAALAGVSQANQIFFLVALTVPGIAAGAGVLVAQAYGKGDIDRIHGVLAYAYRVAMVFILVLTAVVFFFTKEVMGIYTTDAQAIKQGVSYLRIAVWSYLFYTATTITTDVLRAVGTVKICFYTSLISLLLNVGGNWLLIEGRWGFPAMGVAGAALATLFARAGEFFLVLYFVYAKEDKVRIRLYKLKKLDKSLCRIFFATALPVIINEMFWAFGVSAQAVVLGRLGNEVVSANSVGSSVTQMASVLCHGVSAAACVLTGNTIGAQKYGEIKYLKIYFQRFSILLGLIAGGIVLCFSPFVGGIYHIEGRTMDYCRQILYINAFILPFMQLQSTNMMGLLRGGGDVRFQMANDLIFLWGVTVPLGFLSAFVLHAPVAVIYCCLKCDQVIKVFTSEWRLRKGTWIHNMNLSEKEND